MASLLELRKQASDLGIRDYAKYPKEELQALIDSHSQAAESEETVLSPEELEEKAEQEEREEFEKNEEKVKELEEAGEVLDITGDKEAQITGKVKKNAADIKEKPVKVKSVKKAKSEKAPASVLNIKPIEEKEMPTGKTALAIYHELLKNDGRSFGQIAKDLSTHYNMVRNVKEKYFEDISE